MSVEALTWAFKQKVGDPIAKLLLIGIANHCNHDGVCWPGRKRLAEYIDRTVDTVDRKIALLCERGLLIKEPRTSDKGDKTSNAYLLPGVAAPVRPPQPQSSAATLAAPVRPPCLTNKANRKNNTTGAGAPDSEFGDADGNPPEPPFEAFYRLYPRHTGKDAALRSWTRMNLDNKADVILPALAEQKRAGMFRTEEPRFIPHPATWLNQGRWQDEIVKTTHERTNGTQKAAAQNPRNSTHMRQGIYKGVEDA